MKKKVFAAILLMMVIGLCGCSMGEKEDSTTESVSKESSSNVQENNKEDPQAVMPDAEKDGIVYKQGGPYGELSICVPEDWRVECCSVDSRDDFDGRYGFKINHPDTPESYITVCYERTFGVCGTGLEEKEVVLSGYPANVGYYDGRDMWDFVAYRGANEGIVAIAQIQESDWNAYETALSILDTVLIDSSIKEGGIYTFTPESEVVDIGVQMTLENITAKGAKISFVQWDSQAPKGELCSGQYFRLEKKTDGADEWKELMAREEYMVFTEEEWIVQNGTTSTFDVVWEYLYGPLEPGMYRLTKEICEYSSDGERNIYDIKSVFLFEGETA